MSFMRLQHLMGRVYGTMYAVVWMGTSAITAGFNISDNSLVQFLFEFCFDPDTPVQLASGARVPIKDVRIGDVLAATPSNPAPTVTSVFEFDGARTPMVCIAGDVVVSQEHYVWYGAWIPAKAHPHARPVPSIPKLVCLNVTGHEFTVGHTGQVVADYDEHSTPDVIAKTQALAEKALNGGGGGGGAAATTDPLQHDYQLGIDPVAEVYMSDGTWTPMHNIQIGDSVWNSGTVCGIVHERVTAVATYNGIRVSAAQLVYDCVKHKWVRNLGGGGAARINTVADFTQLITMNGSAFRIRCPTTKWETYVRDYREIPNPEMEDAYVEKFTEKLTPRPLIQTCC
jgi:hypothetical protein